MSTRSLSSKTSRLSRKKNKECTEPDSSLKQAKIGTKAKKVVNSGQASSSVKPDSSSALDLSSDFTGGCSQFQYTAAKALIVQKHGAKRKKLEAKDGEERDEQRAKQTKGENEEDCVTVVRKAKIIGRRAESVKNLNTEENSKEEKEEDYVTVVRKPKNAEKSDKETSDIREEEIDLSTVKNNEENVEESVAKKCNTCSQSVPAKQFATHTLRCLRKKFERKPSKDKECDGGDVISCQICDAELSELTDTERQQHYNCCLDGGDDTSATASTAPPPTTQQQDNRCHVCSKNLSHLGTTAKMKHVNRCMDEMEQIEKQKKAEQDALEKAKNKVMDCPFCGQKLKTTNSRKTHLKKCSKQCGVSTAQMMDRVKQQEEEYDRDIQAGIIPQESRRPGRPKRPVPSISTRNPPAVTRVRVDEDTALAIALSKSLREEEIRQKRTSIDEFSLGAAVPMLEEDGMIEASGSMGVRDAFSMLMTPKPKEKVRRRKKKGAPEKVPQLLMQSALDTHDKLTRRVAEIILPRASSSQAPSPKFHRSSLMRKYSNSSSDKENDAPHKANQQNVVWSKTSLTTNTEFDFYVASLMPPIKQCTLPAGSKIKKMTQIPGWKPLQPQPLQDSEMAEAAGKDNETMLVSTQAMMLAELADGNVTRLDQTRAQFGSGSFSGLDVTRGRLEHTSLNRTVCELEKESGKLIDDIGGRLNSSVCEDQPSGFFEVEVEKEPASSLPGTVSGLQTDLGRMVNNPLASDINIVCSNGETIPAHSFVLAARCPHLYQACAKGSTIDLHQYSQPAILATLQYLYSAQLSVAQDILQEVHLIANRLHLKELSLHCSKAIDDLELDSDPLDDLDKSVGAAANIDKSLQNILKEVWGSEEEEEDSSDGEKEEEEEEEEKEELDDLYAFMATQQQKAGKNKNESQDVDTDEEQSEQMIESEFDGFKDDDEVDERINVSKFNMDVIDEMEKEFEEDETENEDVEKGRKQNNGDLKRTNSVTGVDNEKENSSDSDSVTFDDANCGPENIEDSVRSISNVVTPELYNSESESVISENKEEENNEDSGSDLFDSFTSAGKIDSPKSMATDECGVLDLSCNAGRVGSKKDNILLTPKSGKCETPKSTPSPVFISQAAEKCNSESERNVSTNLFNAFQGVGNQEVMSDVESGVFGLESKKRKRPISSESSHVCTPKRVRDECFSDSPVFEKTLEVASKAKSSEDSSKKISVPSSIDLSVLHDDNTVDLTMDDEEEEVMENARSDGDMENGERVEQCTSSKSEVEKVSDCNTSSPIAGIGSDINASPVSLTWFPKSPRKVLKLATDQNAASSSSDDDMELPDLKTRLEKNGVAKSPSSKQTPVQDNDFSSSEDETPSQESKSVAMFKSAADEILRKKGVKDNSRNSGKNNGEEEGTASELSQVTKKKFQFKSSKSQCSQITSKISEQNYAISEKSTCTESVVEVNSQTSSDLELANSMVSTDDSFHENIQDTDYGGSELKNLSERGEGDGKNRGRDKVGCTKERKVDGRKSNSVGRDKGGKGDSVDDSSSSVELKKGKGKKSSITKGIGAVGDGKKRDSKENSALIGNGKFRDSAEKIEDMGVCSDGNFRDSAEDMENSAVSADGNFRDSPEEMENSIVDELPDMTFGDDDDGVLNMVMDQVEKDDDYDPPTDVSMNVSGLSLMKTPAPVRGKNKKPLAAWVPPSPFTPMPEYETMETPVLKKQCNKYGIRALPKKKMVGMLKDVYARTHQYETDPEFETPEKNTDQPCTTDLATNETAAKKGRGKTGSSKATKSKGEKSNKQKGKALASAVVAEGGRKGIQAKIVAKVTTEESSDDENDAGLNDSFEAKSSGTDLPEESMICSQTDSPVSKKDIQYKYKKVWDYIHAKDELRLKILHYEPLEFDEFHQELKTAGISLGKQVLMDFLDDKCVQFSLRGSRKPAKSRKSPKKRGRGSPRKRGRGSPRKRGRGRGKSHTGTAE